MMTLVKYMRKAEAAVSGKWMWLVFLSLLHDDVFLNQQLSVDLQDSSIMGILFGQQAGK